MSNLIQELQRRKVFRVAAVYAVVAWLLIQVADTVLPALQMPEWTVSFVTILFIMGFPIALILSWAYDITPEGVKADAGVVPTSLSTEHRDHKLIYATFVLVLLVVGFQIADRFFFAPAEITPPASQIASASGEQLTVRSSIIIGRRADVAGSERVDTAISPDGARITYVQIEEDGIHLYLRELNELVPRDLVRLSSDFYTNKAPVFSPDSQQIAYRDGSNLMRISVRGDSPQILATGLTEGTMDWESDQSILYSDGINHALYRIAAVGGNPQRLQLEVDSEEQQLIPHVLPGGNALLYNEAIGRLPTRGIRLAMLDTGEVRTLIERGYAARYAASGHIVFMRASTLWAIPFDIERLEITGPEVPVVQGVQASSLFGVAFYSFSDDGRLVYRPGQNDNGAGPSESELVWMYRTGQEEPLDLEPNQYAHPQISPDGEFVSLTVLDSNGNGDVWVQDLRRSILSRRTFSGAAESAIWTPDGANLLFGTREKDWGIWTVPADGTGEATSLARDRDIIRAETLTSDGEHIVYRKRTSSGPNLYLADVNGEPIGQQPLFATDSAVSGADISPDGRWLAYHSRESGRLEVYVRPFPNVEEAKWQMSTDGGEVPRWGPEGKELFYRSGNPPNVEIKSVSINTDAGFVASSPTTLFTGDFGGGGSVFIGGSPLSYDVSPDGQRFLMLKNIRPIENSELEELSLVLVDNWFEELKRLAPPN
jgi:eukaryotic-like serine/threonine-protein kinase